MAPSVMFFCPSGIFFMNPDLVDHKSYWCVLICPPPASLQHYERIAHLHKKTIGRLPETKKGLRTFKMPSTVKDAEQLMTEELGMKEKMINLFAESELKMDQFMASLNDQQSHAPASLDLKAMMASVGDMLMEIKDSQKEFDDFWKVHRSYSEHIMRMCHFSRSGEKVCVYGIIRHPFQFLMMSSI